MFVLYRCLYICYFVFSFHFIIGDMWFFSHYFYFCPVLHMSSVRGRIHDEGRGPEVPLLRDGWAIYRIDGSCCCWLDAPRMFFLARQGHYTFFLQYQSLIYQSIMVCRKHTTGFHRGGCLRSEQAGKTWTRCTRWFFFCYINQVILLCIN